MKNIFIILLIIISVSVFATEVTDGGILSESPKENITIKALTDLQCPALNGQIFGNYLYKGGEITVRSNKTGTWTFNEDFSSENWKDRALYFSSTGGDNLVIHKEGDLGDGALVSDNAMFEDTVIYMIDTRFYPITYYSIDIAAIDTNDLEVFISEDCKNWKSLGNIDVLYWGRYNSCNFKKPFYIKIFNPQGNNWLCLLNLKISANFKMNEEKAFYFDSINDKENWEKKFDTIQSDLDVIKYSGADGLLNGDGNARDQYVVKEIKSPKAKGGEILWTTIQSGIGIYISCDGEDWEKVAENKPGDLSFNTIKIDKKIFDKINKKYKDGYFIKLSKDHINWFALYNYAISLDIDKTFDFSKLKNNMLFSNQNPEGLADITFDKEEDY